MSEGGDYLRSKNLVHSFTCAIEGVLYALKTQRNMKVHFLLGLLVLVFGSILDVNRLELLVLLITVGLVISAEMINTAIEEVVNLVTREYHPLAKIAKNVAAGAVLVTSLISVCVAYVIFIERLLFIQPALLRQSITKPYLTLMALLAVIVITIAAKAWAGWSNFFQGGMPSGHAAIAFSVATAIFFSVEGFVVLLGLLLAFLVAQSRLEAKFHSRWEVVVGALLGILVTVFFFQMKG